MPWLGRWVTDLVIEVFIRGALVYSSATEEFSEGWKNSSVTTLSDDTEAFALVPGRLEYYRNGETVEVKVIAFGLTETWQFTATQRALRISTNQMINKSIRDEDS